MREQTAANAMVLKRLAETDKTLLQHDEALMAIWSKLQPLLDAAAGAEEAADWLCDGAAMS